MSKAEQETKIFKKTSLNHKSRNEHSNSGIIQTTQLKLLIETSQGRGVLGVVDGYTPLGIEGPKDIEERKEFLRKIGQK